MKLDTALNLPRALQHLSQLEKVEYFQTAYESVINKLRLNIGLFPFMLDKACKLDKLNDKASIVGSGSEIAFKEIVAFTKANMQQEIDNEVYETSVPIIGNPVLESFGYDITTLAEINEEHEIAPSIYSNGTDIICTNMDTAFMNILAYQYPYPVLISETAIPLEITSTLPIDEATGVLIGNDIEVTFNNNIDASTVNIDNVWLEEIIPLNKSLTVTYPNGGETVWDHGADEAITWTSDNITSGELVKIHLYRNDVYSETLIDSIENTGTYIWEWVGLVPEYLVFEYKIYIELLSDDSVNDLSDEQFQFGMGDV